MALLADQSADASSNLVGGAGSQSKRFTMPGNVAIKVESVVATITNGAGSAVTPELTIQDQSGAVIGTQRQDASIPAGDTGTATYALRLNGNFGTAAGFIRYKFANTGAWLQVLTTSTGPTGKGMFFSSSNGLTLNNDAGPFNISDFGTGLSLSSSDDVNIDCGIGHLIDIDSGGGTVHLAGGGNADVNVSGGAVTMSPSVLVTLTAGATVEVRDHLNNPIFRVDEDGDLHGLTGKALVFDL